MAHRSWSIGSKTDSTNSTEPTFRVPCGLSTQQPLTPEELWDTYFGVDAPVYSGLDLESKRTQGNLQLESEYCTDPHLSLAQRRSLSSQQDSLNHSPQNCPSPADVSNECLTGKPCKAELKDPEGAGLNTVSPWNTLISIKHSGLASTKLYKIAQMTRCSTVRAVDQDLAQGYSKYYDQGTEVSSYNQFNGQVSGSSQVSARPGSNMKSSSTRQGIRRHIVERSTSPAQEGLLIALNDQTDDLLRTPMTPSPSDLVDADGFPPSVGKATKDINQGLFSDGTLFRDCLVPKLVLPKLRSLPGKGREVHDFGIVLPASSEHVPTNLQQPDQPAHVKQDGPSPMVKPRDLSHEQQNWRLQQAPLSAIYEECGPPAGVQHGCACQGCKEMPESKGIIWFHLCERYKAVAQENGITYEPYEGRLVLHHSHGRSSVGLITEGPFEDRFVPAVTAALPVAERSILSTSKRVRAPRPPRLELQSLHSAAGRTAKAAPQSKDSSKPASVPTPALQRPISPTRVSRPAPLNQLPTVYCPESARGRSTVTTTECKKIAKFSVSATLEHQEDTEANCGSTVNDGAIDGGIDTRGANNGASNTGSDVHPALRLGYVQPTQWTTPPTRSQSRASFREGSPQPSRSGRFNGARLSVGSSNISGERPARIDSLGAPTNPGTAEPGISSRVHEQPKMDSPFKSQFARHIAAFAAPLPLVSPSAAHEHTPSEYLCPSTPSTSSHDDLATLYTHAGEDPMGTALKQKINVRGPFQSSDLADSTSGFLQSPSPFSPQSYRTAPRSQGEASTLLPARLEARIASSSAIRRLSSNDPREGAPSFQTRAYHQPQASKHSIAQSLPYIDSLHFQRHSGRVSGTTLLNDTAFDSTDETSPENANEGQPPVPDHERHDSYHVHVDGRNVASIDPLLIAGAAEARRAGILESYTHCNDASPLQTIGATEAHCTDKVTSLMNAQHPSRRASVPLGQGIANSSLTCAARTNNDVSPYTSSASSSINDPKPYLSSFSPAHRTQLPPGRFNMIDQNISSHYDKLQAWLGIDASTTSASSVSPSPVNPLKKLQSMGMLDLLAADGKLVRKEGGVMKQVVKKGSQRFKEGREKFVGKMKKGLKVRPDDWLDSDDGRY
ncbi:MAG: hypothetical protein LQ346_002581 [Caloplaca aetnensis]|nr:MAG: hypothetical protein LQ346_002581 [Caloplaca aetnensis]